MFIFLLSIGLIGGYGAREMKNKNKVIALCVISVLAICVMSVLIFYKISIKKEEQAVKAKKYETHTASTRTVTVGGQYPYVRYSDLIIDIPEEAFLNFNDRDHSVTYDDVVSEFGEPSGNWGNGIIHDYWRIGEDKYAVCDCIGFWFTICDGQDVLIGYE